MPLNKDALIRYRVINRCLLNGKCRSKDELIQACEDALDISPLGKRTIEGDIHDMRNDPRLGYNAPIKYDAFRGGYCYDDPSYSIDKLPISDDEMHSLIFAAKLLDQYKTIDVFSTFSGAVDKINNTLNIRQMQHHSMEPEAVLFEKAPSFKGSEYLKTILKAILDKDVVEIVYKKFNSNKTIIHIVHPYLLKEYRNRWYVIGHEEKLDEVRTFGLDRIEGIETLYNKIYKETGFDAEAHFRNSIGITSPNDDQAQKIRLKFSKPQAHYVLTKPLHESQVVIEDKVDYTIIELNVFITYELISQILGYGKDVVVMEPKRLKNEIKSELKKTLELY
jgi:predicted DNA-binding transcriptional regulator YafY